MAQSKCYSENIDYQQTKVQKHAGTSTLRDEYHRRRGCGFIVDMLDITSINHDFDITHNFFCELLTYAMTMMNSCM